MLVVPAVPRMLPRLRSGDTEPTATTFAMTPSTTYTRNGTAATFAGIRAGDTGTICAVEQLPSGVLLASWVEVTGP